MKVNDYLSAQEIQQLTEKSNRKGWCYVIGNWILIAMTFAIPALWPNPLSVLVAIVLLGGRQLALSVLTHECGHRSLFKSKALNNWVGNWLISYPVMLDMEAYAKGHLQHHRLAGTRDDPDLSNYREYPINRQSFYRKIWRDISGQTALKAIKGSKRPTGDGFVRGQRNPNTNRRALLVNALLFSVLWACGHPWLYFLWPLAFITSYMLVLRIRQIAEHADVPDLYDPDPRKNTRTTYANWLERLLIAPNQVNYHLEHHLLASVPAYHLKRMHQLLKARGAYADTPIAGSYWQVIQQVTHPSQAIT